MKEEKKTKLRQQLDRIGDNLTFLDCVMLRSNEYNIDDAYYCIEEIKDIIKDIYFFLDSLEEAKK